MRFQILAVILLLVLGAFCKKKPAEPPPELLAKYTADVDRYCKAIVACIKEDVGARLAEQPERRDMVLGRLDRDLCLKGQIQLIGKLSVDPAGKATAFVPEHYETYSACAAAVAESETCAERRTAHKTHPACKRLREIQKQD